MLMRLRLTYRDDGSFVTSELDGPPRSVTLSVNQKGQSSSWSVQTTAADVDHASLTHAQDHMNRQYALHVLHGWTKRKPRITITTVVEHAAPSNEPGSWCF